MRCLFLFLSKRIGYFIALKGEIARNCSMMGGHVLALRSAYHPVIGFLDTEMKKYGVEVTYLERFTPEEIERSLLAAAVEDAKGRAAAVASAGGRRLGALIRASIGSAGAAPQPRMMKGFAGDAMNAAAAPATQLSPGVIKVTVSMSLVFELANR